MEAFSVGLAGLVHQYSLPCGGARGLPIMRNTGFGGFAGLATFGAVGASGGAVVVAGGGPSCLIGSDISPWSTRTDAGVEDDGMEALALLVVYSS